MEAASQVPGVSVVLQRGFSVALAPECPHGPTLLFTRILQGKEKGRRFYACSACRGRKDCNFFQWEDEKISEARLSARRRYNETHRPSKTHADNVKRLHELIQLEASPKGKISMKSLLLDIDFRYSLFYPEEDFCHYNMFNHCFFAGEAASRVCEEFLQQDQGRDVVMVADPPFGGLVEALASSFQKLTAMWSPAKGADSANKELPILWIFPYFFESRILEFFPSFTMLDYQVDYDNHALYKHGKKGRKQSPVRIFTNLSPSSIVLPAEEGYRFCSVCQRYVSSENQHCDICNSCTSKDGRHWAHCNLCKKCVKPSWIHCSICDRCAIPSHPCKEAHSGCFICGEATHKRTACPNRQRSRRVDQDSKRAKQKKKKIKGVVVKIACGKKAKAARRRKNKK
ncbi:rRNA N6-adenosine-methyltransferase ZCCHC4 isoform X3 [Candoia aspera]|uniref:rRNA N6-adenosine-methyltransferase ZCCHC4 isoform X3 n=1 Tax=Candoia aspera TaxID=51853 RepID=UPI002FD7B1B1